MAFDSARSRVVLFGGLGAAPPTRDTAQDSLGDTWEHVHEATASLQPDSGSSPDFTIQPATVTFRDAPAVVFSLPLGNEPIDVQLFYTSPIMLPHEEKLFLDTLTDLDERIKSQDDYVLLGAASLLRKLFVDDYPLVDQVNKKYRIKLEFKAVVPDDAMLANAKN